MNFRFVISNSHPILFPIKQIEGNYLVKDIPDLSNGIETPTDEWMSILDNMNSDWGYAPIVHILGGALYPLPSAFNITWLSVVEKQLYQYRKTINVHEAEKKWHEDKDDSWNSCLQILIGLAPYGGVAIWFRGYFKSILFSWDKAEAIDIQQVDDNLLPEETFEELYEIALGENEEVRRNLLKNGLPQSSYFNQLMDQYYYRFVILLKKWDEKEEIWKDYEEDEKYIPGLDFVEAKCFDGTYDKLRDGSLMEYHTSGKPSHLTIAWHVGKKNYGAYFFFDHEELQVIFNRCYGAHPDTKVDILVQMDPETNHYELALYRYGMKEPLKIDESAYQLMVFKNKFECFRSENYNLPPGSWRW